MELVSLFQLFAMLSKRWAHAQGLRLTLGPSAGITLRTSGSYVIQALRFTSQLSCRTNTFVGRKGQVFRRPAAADGEESEVPADSLSLSLLWFPDRLNLLSRRVQNDLEYVVSVTIGTPGVTLNLAGPSWFIPLSTLANWWSSGLWYRSADGLQWGQSLLTLALSQEVLTSGFGARNFDRRCLGIIFTIPRIARLQKR
jgi:hypothetical protein